MSLKNYSEKELKKELQRRKDQGKIAHLPKPPYDKVYGTWTVTTEGDVEGRTKRHLGIHTGYVDEIARSLAHNTFYSLTFSAADQAELKPNKKIKEASVTFGIGSGLWDLNPEERAKVVQEIFKGRPVSIERGQYFASVIINFED